MLLRVPDFSLQLTGDGKTLLKGGVGLFYDRIPLMVPIFPDLPNRTVTVLGQVALHRFLPKHESTAASKTRAAHHGISNSTASFSQACRCGLLMNNAIRPGTLLYRLSPQGTTGILELSNRGSDSYREFQAGGSVSARSPHVERFLMSGPGPLATSTISISSLGISRNL